MSVIDSLESCVLFMGLPFEAITQIRTQGTIVFLKPGQVLMEQGQRSDRVLFVLLEGEVELRYQAEPQQPVVTLEYLGAGEVIGEIGLFWPHPRIASAISTKTSRLLQVPLAQLQKIQTERHGPILMLNLVCLMSNRIDAMNKKVTAQTQVGLQLVGATQQLPVALLSSKADPVKASTPTTSTPPVLLKSLLEYSALAEYLGPASTEALTNLLEVRRYPMGSVIFQEGAASEELLLICSGAVQVTRQIAEGDILLSTLGAGDLVGEMGVFRRLPRSATARALSPVIGLSLSAMSFYRLLDHLPGLASRLLGFTAQLLEKRLILLNDLSVRMYLLQANVVVGPDESYLTTEQVYPDYRLLQYLFSLAQMDQSYPRALLREAVSALQELARRHGDLEDFCRRRPVTLRPPVMTQALGATPPELLASRIIESGGFFFCLRLGQRSVASVLVKKVLDQALIQEQEYLEQACSNAGRQLVGLPTELKLTLRWKMMQNLTALQTQAMQAFELLGFTQIKPEQSLRLGRELLQPVHDLIRKLTS